MWRVRKCSEVEWSEVKGSEVWWRYEGYVKCSEVEWREGHGEMWVHQFMTLRIPLLLLFSVQYAYFLLILIYIIVVVIVFALYSVCAVCPLLFV
jgi:hypothetical protein